MWHFEILANPVEALPDITESLVVPLEIASPQNPTYNLVQRLFDLQSVVSLAVFILYPLTLTLT